MDIFLQLFEPVNLFVMAIGVLLGIIIGALPGLTPTMGVAMAIPFTFSLPAEYGLLLLGGIYSGAVYGGSIPAILFNIPGAPASVATTFEGYPMAQKGEAKKALELSTISSTIGGILGMLLLLYFAPVFSDFSLRFGATENFWIAIFGITIIAVISDGSSIKNMIGGAVGILISMIGIHSMTGMPRFTFGMSSFVGGLNVVSVLIGLFAFPQALRLIENLRNHQQGSQIYRYSSSKKTSLLSSFADVFKNLKALSLGSIVGLIVGVAPGAGGNVASIMAYNELKRFSKNKEAFGKGNKEGIIASESANNAEVGGALIPLLTLGIPGSPTSAIFLGGLMIHGIWPGRDLFVQHAEVANLFLYGMLVIQILLLLIGLIAIRYLSKLVNVPNYFMAPVIISFSIIGAYTTQNNTFDIYSMVIIGIFMYLFQKFDFSPAPVALGFILGPIAEEGLLQGIALGESDGSIFHYFTTGIYNWILISLTILTISYSLWQSFKKKDRIKEKRDISFSLHSLLTWQGISWLIFSVLTLVAIYNVRSLAFEMKLFPLITLSLLLLFNMIQIVKLILNSHIKRITDHERTPLNTIYFLTFISVISLLTDILGFYTQVLILMISVPFYVYLQRKRIANLYQIMFISTSFTLIMYLVFSGLIKVPLPSGLALNLLNFFLR
ncbi:tripartite tricarboxylate transporter permease [Tepidibacillus sp. HK-1]|uniref:tripartite tricarboxylate transporter permease n=1 Tax=Tepidibacillus sp. HK-1 TaxID=1883407 RepID=UPI000853D95B|nr:tripartite tricarboxylate transporter permease [Tepidibacillus sp. HK-1]GBF10419.1 tripartite tricarboxylate transporter TctA family protein [Tepidibacillus sp. HK-1]